MFDIYINKILFGFIQKTIAHNIIELKFKSIKLTLLFFATIMATS